MANDILDLLPPPRKLGQDYFDLPAALEALKAGKPLVFPPFCVTHVKVAGRVYNFCSNYKQDPIQRRQRSGQFYEPKDLGQIADHLPVAPRILDVGANVGNHALYFATQCNAHVTVIEPNPVAMAPLVANVVLNGLQDRILLDHLGIGLGAGLETGLSMPLPGRNLGGTRMQKSGEGDLEVHAGDALFAGRSFDLIKIDVEEMEMEVIAGLDQTIRRCRPLLFVEVDDVNADEFLSWCRQENYGVVFETRQYRSNANYLVRPEPV